MRFIKWSTTVTAAALVLSAAIVTAQPATAPAPGTAAGGVPPFPAPPPGAFLPGTVPPQGALPAGFVPPQQEPQSGETSTRVKGFEKMFADAQYAPLIEKLNARLAEAKRKKEKLSLGEQFAIHRLKGESYLRLKSQQQAISAFKEAASLEVADTLRAEPAAMVLLLQRSKQFAYAPRSGESKGQPIDVLADRKRALEALLGDELEAARPKVQGKTPTALPQVLQMLEQTKNLRTIELATTGGQAPQTVELLAPIGMQARQLMTDALNSIHQDILAIRASANRTTVVTNRLSRTEYKAGLSDGDKAALRNHFDTALRIGRAATDLAQGFPNEAPALEQIAAKSLEIRDAADAVANGDYKQRTYARE